MGRVLRIAAIVVGVAALTLTGIGVIVGPVALAGITAAIGGVTAAMLSVAATVLSIGASLLSPKPKTPNVASASLDRLHPSLDPRTNRKAVFGDTALGADVRDHEVIKVNDDLQYVHRFFVHAAHKLTSVDEIWFDDEKVWTLAGGVVAGSSAQNFLTVATRLEGNAGNAINIGGRGGATRRYTGCGYTHLRFEISKKSPYASAIPTRILFRGRGMPTYDPRKDTTAGGSGTQRANDQTTWTFDSGGNLQGNNPALQMLTWLLGWSIQNPVTSAFKLSVGRGIPANRINMASFIAAANICDEAVSLSAGGTERRYRAAAIVSEGEDPTSVVDRWKAAMNATLDDMDGQIRLQILVNDLGAPVADFAEKDVMGGFTWRPFLNLTEGVNIVRGLFVSTDNKALFEMIEYPEVKIASLDGIDRIETVNYDMVQSPSQAQRLSKARLQRMQYPGIWEGVLETTGWKVQKGDPIRFTFGPCGFNLKLFRVADIEYRADGYCPVKLREENAAIYQWDTTQEGLVTYATAVAWNPLENPWFRLVGGGWAAIVSALADANRLRYTRFEGETRGWVFINNDDGTGTLAKGYDAPTGYHWLRMRIPFDGAGQMYSFANDYLSGNNIAPVSEGERVFVSARLATTIGNAAHTWALKVRWLDAAGVPLASETNIAAGGNVALGSRFSAFMTVPVGARGAAIRLYGNSNASGATATTDLYLIEPMIVSAGADQTALPAFIAGPNNDPAADITKSIEGDTPVIIYATTAGVPKSGQLPKAVGFRVFENGLQITAGVGWVVTLLTGNATFSPSTAGGTLTLTFDGPTDATLALESTFRLSGVTDRGTITREFKVIKQDDPPTNSGGSGGGGSQSTTSLGNTNNAQTYDLVTAISGVLTVKPGAGGQVACTAPISYVRNPGTAVGRTQGAGHWQWRVPAGSWAGWDSEVIGTNSRTFDPGDGALQTTFGSLTCNHTKTGLTPGTDYEFRFVWRDVVVDGNPDALSYVSGTMQAVGS